jgi:hypothetical protein
MSGRGINLRKTMSTIKNISFQEFVRITFSNKLTVYGPEERHVDARWVCAWCKITMYIGEPYRNVPEDLRAWFLTPQQFEEFKQLLQDESEH